MKEAIIYIAYALIIIAFLATACYMHSMALAGWTLFVVAFSNWDIGGSE